MLFSWNESKETRIKGNISVLYRQEKWVNDLTSEKLFVNEHEPLEAETVIKYNLDKRCIFKIVRRQSLKSVNCLVQISVGMK